MMVLVEVEVVGVVVRCVVLRLGTNASLDFMTNAAKAATDDMIILLDLRFDRHFLFFFYWCSCFN